MGKSIVASNTRRVKNESSHSVKESKQNIEIEDGKKLSTFETHRQTIKQSKRTATPENATKENLLQRKLFRKEEQVKSAIVLQKLARMWILHTSYIRKKQSCQTIGRVYKAYKFRLILGRRMVESENKYLNAIQNIQSHFRMVVCKRKYYTRRKAYYTIRGYFATQLHVLKFRSIKRAARRIQISYRLYRSRKIAIEEKCKHKCLQEACIKMQSVARMFIHRSLFLKSKRLCRITDAIVDTTIYVSDEIHQ